MVSVKQDNIKYHFLSLWYDSTYDWTQVSRAFGEHSEHYGNIRYEYIKDYNWYISIENVFFLIKNMIKIYFKIILIKNTLINL